MRDERRRETGNFAKKKQEKISRGRGGEREGEEEKKDEKIDEGRR